MTNNFDYNLFFSVDENFKPIIHLKNKTIYIKHINKVVFNSNKGDGLYSSIDIKAIFDTKELKKISNIFSSGEDYSATLRFLDCEIILKKFVSPIPARIQGCSNMEDMSKWGNKDSTVLIRVNFPVVDVPADCIPSEEVLGEYIINEGLTTNDALKKLFAVEKEIPLKEIINEKTIDKDIPDKKTDDKKTSDRVSNRFELLDFEEE